MKVQVCIARARVYIYIMYKAIVRNTYSSFLQNVLPLHRYESKHKNYFPSDSVVHAVLAECSADFLWAG